MIWWPRKNIISCEMFHQGFLVFRLKLRCLFMHGIRWRQQKTGKVVQCLITILSDTVHFWKFPLAQFRKKYVMTVSMDLLPNFTGELPHILSGSPDFLATTKIHIILSALTGEQQTLYWYKKVFLSLCLSGRVGPFQIAKTVFTQSE